MLTRSAALFCGIAVLVTGGCLSLGTRTTYVQETPETLNRIARLETRVESLEQALAPQPSPGLMPESVPAFRPASP